MATLLSRSLTSRTLLTSTSLLTAAGVTCYTTQRPLSLDSAQNVSPLSKTLSFPKTILFAKQLTVTAVEEINHDTKRITFALPGGSTEISGVPASCTSSISQHMCPSKLLKLRSL